MIAMRKSLGGYAFALRRNINLTYGLEVMAHRPTFWFVSLAAAIGTAVVVGLPTVLIPSPFFARMTPVRPLDYVFWLATAVLAGLLMATYFPSAAGVAVACPAKPERLTVGGLLSTLAVGCPVCNKVAVLLLGTSGAMAYFAPLQPLLGVTGLALLAVTLIRRLRALSEGVTERLA